MGANFTAVICWLNTLDFNMSSLSISDDDNFYQSDVSMKREKRNEKKNWRLTSVNEKKEKKN